MRGSSHDVLQCRRLVGSVTKQGQTEQQFARTVLIRLFPANMFVIISEASGQIMFSIEGCLGFHVWWLISDSNTSNKIWHVFLMDSYLYHKNHIAFCFVILTYAKRLLIHRALQNPIFSIPGSTEAFDIPIPDLQKPLFCSGPLENLRGSFFCCKVEALMH